MAKYYLLDENKNLVEGFDKEGFLALLEQAIEQGSLEGIDEDSAVASKIRSVLNGTTHHIEFVTQAQYNQLVADEELVANTWYFIIDDTTEEGLENSIEELNNSLEEITTKLNNFQEWQTDIENGHVQVGSAVNTDKTSFTNNGWKTFSFTQSSTPQTIPDYTSGKAYLMYLGSPNETDFFNIGIVQSESGAGSRLVFKFNYNNNDYILYIYVGTRQIYFSSGSSSNTWKLCYKEIA